MKNIPCFDKTLAIVDVETNGGYRNSGQIIEIGILRVERGVVVQTFRSLVKPNRPVPWWITRLTGITNGELEEAPYFEEIAVTVQRLLEGAVFVAHSVEFDYGFVKNEFRRLEMQFRAKRLCTVKVSRALYPRYKRHDLSSLIARHRFECLDRHRAFDDAKVLWDFLSLACNERPHAFEQAIEDQLTRKKRKPVLAIERLLSEDAAESEAFIR